LRDKGGFFISKQGKKNKEIYLTIKISSMNDEFFMNYAEGKESPTVKYNDEKESAKEAERLAEKLGVEVTTLKAVTKTAPKDITKRVKSYNDACVVLGIEPENEEVLTKLGFTKDEIAYRKLKTIAKALNESWEPDWSNSNQYKYWPWFVFSVASAGFAFADAHYASSAAHTYVGSRLCFKTAALARYVVTQFIDIYNDFLLINK
jgi:predicted flap endonuclease-1-like 5' DNA nuclease